jgi:GcrA cell cycle regulator
MAKSIKKPTKPSKLKTLLDLGSRDCRWPIGEPRQPGFHFCGVPQLPGRPYCERHWRMAFQPAKPRYQTRAVIPATAAEAA